LITKLIIPQKIKNRNPFRLQSVGVEKKTWYSNKAIAMGIGKALSGEKEENE
jgi:hypothetical protein